MTIDFRMLAASQLQVAPDLGADSNTDMVGEEYHDAAPLQPTFEPPTCSYCGGTEFEPQEDNGRAVRSKCSACGGTMVSSGGAFQPDLIGSPHNHPKMDADPASGGVGGTGTAPVVLQTNDLSSRTAMPSRSHPLDPAHVDFRVRHHHEDDDDFDRDDSWPDMDSRRPGWNHHTLDAHLFDPHHRSGYIEYSTRDDDKPTLAVHHMQVRPADQRKGLASAMQDHLRELHPDHMFDHGSRTLAGEDWHAQYDDPGRPELDLDHPSNVHAWSQHVAGADWCRHRHAEHCWLPMNDRQAAVALYPPTDRGRCPWPTAQTQQVNCPMSEPGPMAGMERAASTTSRNDLGWHFTATWADVRNKAKRIRAEGGVTVVVSSMDGIGGHVQGDTGIYETILSYQPGSTKVGTWTCGCAWAAYAWNRSPAYRRFEGRMCSHALALQFEALARGMFGRTIQEDDHRPAWMRDKVRQRYDRDTGVHDLVHASLHDPLDPEGVYPGGHGLDLGRPPVYAFVLDALGQGDEPAQAMAAMLTAGLEHTAARTLVHDAIDELQFHGALPGERHETRCPDCGQPVSSSANKCPHCGARLNEGDTGDLHLGAKEPEKAPEPSHAGVVLKAGDTGRVLMIQRSHKDESDPARGKWEFPGGRREPGDRHSLHSGIREFEEEVGQPFPHGGHVQHAWQSQNGVYQGHVVVVPSEGAVDFSNGRATTNPDDPDGDDHEQSAWWHPDEARKNPALRDECKASPWGQIKAASLGATATYSSNDLLADPELGDYRPKPPQQPMNSDDENPGSTGFATGGDPPEFDQQLSTHVQSTPFAAAFQVREEDLRGWSSSPLHVAAYERQQAELHAVHRQADATIMASLVGELHQPEPALPTTTAEEETPGERYRSEMSGQIGELDIPPTGQHTALATATTDEIIAAFQATAAGKALASEKGTSNVDIASAARTYLAGASAGPGLGKTALKAFTFAEQQELISEGVADGTRARNLGDLQIEGTHYEVLQAALAAQGATEDAEDLFT